MSPNIASFVGATTVRIDELGQTTSIPTPEQLARMRALVRRAMDEGAMGSAARSCTRPRLRRDRRAGRPGEQAARCGGMYISHMRSEGDAHPRSRSTNWSRSPAARARRPKSTISSSPAATTGRSIDEAIPRIEAARAAGPAHHRRHVHLYRRRHRPRRSMPLWVQAGGPRPARAAARSGDPRPRRRRDAPARPGLGEPLPRRRRRTASCSASSAIRRCANMSARRSPRSRGCAARARRRPRWTSSSRTTAGSARSIS